MDATANFIKPAVRGATGSLGEIVQSPLVRSTVRYWWVALPIGFVAYHCWQKHKDHGKPLARAINDTIVDVAPVVGTVAALLALNCMLGDRERRAAASAAPIKNAAFTVRPAPPKPASAPALPAPEPPQADLVTE